MSWRRGPMQRSILNGVYRMNRGIDTINNNRGIGLIEVLVTVVVLSIGLLGIAALQVMSKQSNFEAVQRSTASMLANDMIERMRANVLALPTSVIITPGSIAEPSPKCLFGDECTPAELLLHDQWEWEQVVRGASEKKGGTDTGGLVRPTVCITGPGGGVTGMYSVAIAWRGQTALSDPTVANACGQGSGLYDDSLGNPDVQRRLLVLDAFINAS